LNASASHLLTDSAVVKLSAVSAAATTRFGF